MIVHGHGVVRVGGPVVASGVAYGCVGCCGGAVRVAAGTAAGRADLVRVRGGGVQMVSIVGAHVIIVIHVVAMTITTTMCGRRAVVAISAAALRPKLVILPGDPTINAAVVLLHTIHTAVARPRLICQVVAHRLVIVTHNIDIITHSLCIVANRLSLPPYALRSVAVHALMLPHVLPGMRTPL